jgi:hypothetical protein
MSYGQSPGSLFETRSGKWNNRKQSRTTKATRIASSLPPPPLFADSPGPKGDQLPGPVGGLRCLRVDHDPTGALPRNEAPSFATAKEGRTGLI